MLLRTSSPNKQGETLATRLRRDLFTLLSTPNDKGELGWPTGTLDVPTLGGSTDAELRTAVEELLGGAARRFRRLTRWQYAAGQRTGWGSAH